MCGTRLQLPIERVDAAVLGALAGDVLRPAVVLAVIDGVVRELAPQVTGRRDSGRADLQNVDREIGG